MLQRRNQLAHLDHALCIELAINNALALSPFRQHHTQRINQQ